LLAITLVFIFAIGPTTASFDSGKSAILSGHKSGSGYSSLISRTSNGSVKPDFYLNPDFSGISNPIKKIALNSLATDPIIYWDPAFMN